MKFTAKRLLAAGAVGISAIVTPLALTVALPAVGSAPSSVAGAQGLDQIIYGQTTGSPATYYEFAPGNGSAPTVQPVGTSAKCGAPTVSGPPILAVSAKEYAPTPNSDYYLNTSSSATPGTSSLQTGVCTISPAWTLDNKSGKGAEALDFSPGSATVVGPNRLFTEAQIPIQRKDTGVAQNPAVSVQLVEFDASNNQVATQTCTINGGQGTQISADTATNAACTGTPAPQAGFETVEVQDLTTSTSISVVGPAATFTLDFSVCGTQSITTPNGDEVTAKLTLTGPISQCKTYTSFSSTIDPNTGLPTLSFNGFSTSNVQFTVHITWPAVPLCNPYVDTPGSPAPGGTTGIPNAPGLAQSMCPVHSFAFDNLNFNDQAYCQTAQAPGNGVLPQQEMCTVTKSYNNDTVNADGTVSPILTSTGAPGTQIVETWVGNVDQAWH